MSIGDQPNGGVLKQKFLNFVCLHFMLFTALFCKDFSSILTRTNCNVNTGNAICSDTWEILKKKVCIQMQNKTDKLISFGNVCCDDVYSYFLSVCYKVSLCSLIRYMSSHVVDYQLSVHSGDIGTKEPILIKLDYAHGQPITLLPEGMRSNK